MLELRSRDLKVAAKKALGPAATGAVAVGTLAFFARGRTEEQRKKVGTKAILGGTAVFVCGTAASVAAKSKLLQEVSSTAGFGLIVGGVGLKLFAREW